MVCQTFATGDVKKKKYTRDNVSCKLTYIARGKLFFFALLYELLWLRVSFSSSLCILIIMAQGPLFFFTLYINYYGSYCKHTFSIFLVGVFVS